jgi:hypothetical protein
MSVNLVNSNNIEVNQNGDNISLDFASGGQVEENTSNIGDLSNLNTTEKSNLVSAINEVQESVEDTGWINLTPATGTWTSLRYRVVGKLVQIVGYASSLTVSNASVGTVATMPSDYKPSVTVYSFATGASSWFGRVNINQVNGNVIIDGCRTINGAYSGTGYAGFNLMYFLD